MPANTELSLERALRKVLKSWGTRKVNITQLAAALAAGDVDRIVALLGATQESLGPVLEQLQRVYVASGQALLATLPSRVVAEVTFGLTNPSVIRYLQSKNLEVLTDLVQEQKDIVRAVLSDVASNRQNPRAVIRQLAGTRGPTGQRTGSVIGLSRPQFEYVTRAREELFSGNPTLMKNYLTRDRRDRTLDHIVNNALREGRPLTLAEVDRLSGRYTDRLLDLRAEAIARTEYHDAVEAARQAGIEHLVSSGKIKESAVTRIWDASKDKRTRDEHTGLDRQRRGLKEPFTAPDGTLMMHPGDRSLGAQAHQVVFCRCTVEIEIDYFADLT